MTLEERVLALEAANADRAATDNLISAWIAKREQVINEISNWQTGTATGGPNGDGKYPLTTQGGSVKMTACPERMAVDAKAYATRRRVSGAGPYVMAISDVGTMQFIGNGSITTNIQIRLPNLPEGSEIGFLQMGSGRLQFVTNPGSGAALAHRQNFFRTAGIAAFATAVVDTVTAGVSHWSLAGDMSA